MVLTAVQRREAPVLDAFGPVPVPRLWPGETVVCIGSGPSLTQEDVDACRDRARIIAIKDVVRMAPWADVLYGAGADNSGRTWWHRHGPGLTFEGLRYTLDRECRQWASVLGMAPNVGLSTVPSALALGHHSGYQAINLAVHLGASKVVLLGYDMQPTGGQDHFFGKHFHGNTPPFALFLASFPQIVEPLKALGVSVVNASRETALSIFPRQSLAEALS
jgi:hypothetical protein